MHIDWFTVGAQAVNFLVLVWLLKRYLYRPILRAIAAREAHTAAQLADAAAKEAQATATKAQFEKLSTDLAAQRVGLIDRARAEADGERERMMADARQAADILRSLREQELRSEVDEMGKTIGRRLCEQVIGIARKTLNDLADADLEERIGEMFTRRLLELDTAAKARLATPPGTPASGAILRSAFVLPQRQRDAMAAALAKVLGVATPLRFDRAPALIGGIELIVNDQKISWDIADYVAGIGPLAYGDLGATVPRALPAAPGATGSAPAGPSR